MKAIFPRLHLSAWDWLILGVCSFPAFYLLGQPALYIWDEAVYANASWDMAHGGSWWLPTHGTYNTKPPLVLWMQALTLKFFPDPEWAIRLPSALATAGILLIMLVALKRWGFDLRTRFCVLICFVANEGFIRHHIARTGDLDAVMSFFVTAYALIVLDAIVQLRWTAKHFFWFFLMVVCAFYSKSIGGWLMLGPLAIVWLLSPLYQVWLRPRFWLGFSISLMLCASYYLIRETGQPGFMDLAWSSEYMRMFRNVMPWHEHGPAYYFQNFQQLHTYTPWIYALALACGIGLVVIKTKPLQDHLLRWIILAAGFLLVITIPAVKLEWYDAPVYPWFALILGSVIGWGLSLLPQRIGWWVLIPAAYVYGHKLLFISRDTSPRHPFEFEGAMVRQYQGTDACKVFMIVEHPEHRLQLDFYQKIASARKGQHIEVVDTVTQLQPGDHVLISQSAGMAAIHQAFDTDTIQVWPGLGYELQLKERYLKESE